MTWGHLIKRTRGAETRKKFAARLGVTPAAVEAWEAGRWLLRRSTAAKVVPRLLVLGVREAQVRQALRASQRAFALTRALRKWV